MSAENPKNLIALMASKEFQIVAQLHPPKVEKKALENFIETVGKLEEKGITVFDINASRLQSRMESFEVATRISKKGRIIIPHATARTELETTLKQANEIYEQYGINHLLVIKGDPPKNGHFPTRVDQVMTSVAGLRTKEGNKKIVLAAAVNQNASDLDDEVIKMGEKINNGADFFMSQLVFDIEQAKKLRTFNKKPLLAGISALDKIGNVEGIVIPEAVRNEEDKIGNNKELLYKKRIERALELVRFIKINNLAQGVYIAAPINSPEEVIPFINEMK